MLESKLKFYYGSCLLPCEISIWFMGSPIVQSCKALLRLYIFMSRMKDVHGMWQTADSQFDCTHKEQRYL
ncbi:hypothetical protein SUGI_0020890 [Cryptomeria japonica]|nr:hypothetical protein SUGI_0020890 [Cryptomeria japonica]